MLSNVAQELEVAHRRGPVGVVDHPRRIGLALEVEPTTQLLLYVGDVSGDGFLGQKLALGVLAAGVADGTGRAAGHGDGMMPEQLEPAQNQEWHQVPDMQTIRRRVESSVDRDRSGFQALVQLRRVSAIVYQAAPLQLVVDVHRADWAGRPARCGISNLKVQI